MPLPRNEDGDVIVTVADLIEFLLKLPQDAEVGLDKDGWMEDEIKPTDVQDLIDKRGVFDYDKRYGLSINN